MATWEASLAASGPARARCTRGGWRPLRERETGVPPSPSSCSPRAPAKRSLGRRSPRGRVASRTPGRFPRPGPSVATPGSCPAAANGEPPGGRPAALVPVGVVSGSDGFAEVIFLERSKRDYADRDRTILALLRPHLIRLRAKATARQRARCAPGLTVREGEILALLAEGKTNPQIARVLYVSPHTVRKHVENIFDKLDVRTRTEAAAWLTSNGRNLRAVDEP